MKRFNVFLDDNGKLRNPLDKKKSRGRKIGDGIFLCLVGVGLSVLMLYSNALTKEVLLFSLLCIGIGVLEIFITVRKDNTEKSSEEIRVEIIKDKAIRFANRFKTDNYDNFDDEFDDEFDSEIDLFEEKGEE